MPINSLKWDEIKLRKIKSAFFSGKDRIESGASCVFIQLSKKVGAKIYFSRKNRDLSFKNQNKAYKKGIAPKVGEKFSLGKILCISAADDFYDSLGEVDYYSAYGYLTEIAESLKREPSYKSKNMKEIFRIFQELGFYPDDIRKDNLGRINGKLVVIDFDDKTTS